MEIPDRPDRITADWLTEALRAGGFLTTGRVESLSVEELGLSTGLTSVLARLTPVYDDGGDAPASMIAKLPPEDEVTRALGTSLRLYEREAKFFKELAPTAGVSVPRLYWGDVSPDGSAYLLLLEDMGRVGTREGTRDLTPPDMASALSALADMHARWWENRELDAYPWLMAGTGRAVNTAIQRKFNHAWPGVIERHRSRFPAGLEDLGNSLGKALGRVLEQHIRPPLTLTHSHLVPENVHVRRRGTETETVFISWQAASKRPAAWDVAMLLAFGFPVDVRRAREQELLHLYHRQLLDRGVRDYPIERLHVDFRAGLLRLLWVFVIEEDNLDFTFAGAGDIPTRHLDRLVALVDWNCAELLS